ncbi:MAG: hypothetical protein LC753_19535 [Acidobacteria bacterium]|nr:hypothetical protein [Acidobacteriota bacterium]
MRKYGVFQISDKTYSRGHQRRLEGVELQGTHVQGDTVVKDGAAVGVVVDGVAHAGFNTPSRLLEFYSPTLVAWGWPEHSVPAYVPGHVHWRNLSPDQGEFDLLPNFRLPTLIHTRSPVKWLYEISHDNPLWISTEDARKHEITTGDLVRVTTRIGYFVTRAWVTEGIRPGVLGMSHHLGRWRLQENQGGPRVASALVRITREDGRRYVMKQVHGARPFESADKDTGRIWWSDVGVHQNLTFPVQPDPVSGMHCWHQRVKLERAAAGDSYGDLVVDTNEAHAAYKEWMEKTRPAPGPDGLRRPLWFDRPLRPVQNAYQVSST